MCGGFCRQTLRWWLCDTAVLNVVVFCHFLLGGGQLREGSVGTPPRPSSNSTNQLIEESVQRWDALTRFGKLAQKATSRYGRINGIQINQQTHRHILPLSVLQHVSKEPKIIYSLLKYSIQIFTHRKTNKVSKLRHVSQMLQIDASL